MQLIYIFLYLSTYFSINQTLIIILFNKMGYCTIYNNMNSNNSHFNWKLQVYSYKSHAFSYMKCKLISLIQENIYYHHIKIPEVFQTPWEL